MHHSSTSHRAYSDSRKVNESIRVNKCTKNYTISTSVKIYTSTDSLRVKLNRGRPWQKQHSTTRLFSPANWTSI